MIDRFEGFNSDELYPFAEIKSGQSLERLPSCP